MTKCDDGGFAGESSGVLRACSYGLLNVRCPTVECLSLLPIERILHINRPRYRPLRDTDVIKHEADRVRVDAKRSHSGRHSTAQVVHAEMVKPEVPAWPG